MSDIANLEINVRTYNQLKRIGIDTIERLAQLDDEELLAVPMIGKKSLWEIRQALGNAGFTRVIGRERSMDTPNIHRSVVTICRKLGLTPNNVRRLEITPRTLVATEYLLDDEGRKYLAEDGKPATRLRAYEVIA